MLSYNAAELLRAAPGTTDRIELAVSSLHITDEYQLARPIVGEIRLSQSGRGILIRGHLDTALVERCARCLRPAEASVSVDIDEEALPGFDLHNGAALDRSEEPDVVRLDGHHELDLEPIVRDAISLAEPIAPLCRPDCPGLCEDCGVDLTTSPLHAHERDDIDPRLAPLAALRDNLH